MVRGLVQGLSGIPQNTYQLYHNITRTTMYSLTAYFCLIHVPIQNLQCLDYILTFYRTSCPSTLKSCSWVLHSKIGGNKLGGKGTQRDCPGECALQLSSQIIPTLSEKSCTLQNSAQCCIQPKWHNRGLKYWGWWIELNRGLGTWPSGGLMDL